MCLHNQCMVVIMTKNKSARVLLYIIIITAFASLLLYPTDIIAGINKGIDLSVKIIIPSLFCFFVLSEMLTSLPFPKMIEKLFTPVTRLLFGIGGSCVLPFMLGCICGFPVAAKSASDMYKNGKISKREASILLYFCNNASASFIIISVGFIMHKSMKTGIYLYLIQLLSSVITGIILSRTNKKDKIMRDNSILKIKTNKINIFELLVNNIRSAAVNMLYVCAFVVFFSAVSGIANKVFSFFKYRNIILGFIEMTNALSLMSESVSMSEMTLVSFILSISGLCVIMQISAMLYNSGLSIKNVILGKTLQSAIAVMITLISFNIIL